ncbi:MAG: hypothetical protein BWY10_01896 [Chloroflexi bacterium ADurb.Bin180]|nr:MAG: hypothetical protein BWY10_01896 [Chloroflexi bacterium ADurb.Bin180]
MRKQEAQAIVIGAFLGALSGAALGLLYQRQREQDPTAGRLPRGQVVRLGVRVVSLARQFFDLLAR